MKRSLFVCLALFLAVGSLPAVAGTVYVPVLGTSGSSNDVYVTRVWLTNEGDSPVTVQTYFIPAFTDGTADRGDTTQVRVAPGQTTVIMSGDGDLGMLEVTAGEMVAINAEVRNIGQTPQDEIRTDVPVISSSNMAGAGDTLTLQGLRRTDGAITSNVMLVNLGHDQTQCSAEVFRAGGKQIASTALVTIKALSFVLVPDALQVLGESEIADANAQITCDQPFYAFSAAYQSETGNVVAIEPSATGASSLSPPGKAGGSPPPPAGAVVFEKSGTFHIPTKSNPTQIFNIDTGTNRSFSQIVIDMDFYNGGWYAKDPGGNHSLFWLQRGAYHGPSAWPVWASNIVGFVNAFGPNKNKVKVTHNLDLPKPQRKDYASSARLDPGNTYHLHYVYDAAGGDVTLVISKGSALVMRQVSPATTGRINTDESGTFMIYFGHEDVYGLGLGSERPTYGWRYQNLEVQFIP